MHDDQHQATLYFTCDLLKNRDRAFSSKFIIMTLSNNYKTFTHTMHEFDEKYFYFQPFCCAQQAQFWNTEMTKENRKEFLVLREKTFNNYCHLFHLCFTSSFSFWREKCQTLLTLQNLFWLIFEIHKGTMVPLHEIYYKELNSTCLLYR